MRDSRILVGDVIDGLRSLPSGSVRCCVTSPPYWGLRDYGHAGQIGLEKTPEEYIAKMVEVFREVRRVLTEDGTVFLNLGDSYAGSGKGGGGSFDAERRGWTRRDDGAVPYGLKPKDLVGIPWSVAKALQAPYYTGTIKNREDRIWLAAMLDAEGCLFIHKRKAGQHNGQGYYRQNDNYGPGVEIANTSLAVVDRIHQLVGKGSICSQGPEDNERRKQTIYRWNLRTVECREFVRELYPHLVAKQQQARILFGCPTSGERAEAAHAALIALHRTGESDVDFPAPPSLYEPGFYLRQDIVWAKANPMPESVTDRCTKAHEYVFLLSKAARYYYDAGAIAEAAVVGWNDSKFDDERDLSIRPTTSRKHRFGGAKYGDSADPKHKTKSGEEYRPTGKRNKRSVWTIATQPFSGAHFAVMPEAMAEPCILAGSAVGDTVLDPFAGSGTVGVVALRHGRHFVGCELNPEYAKMAERRISRYWQRVAREEKKEDGGHRPLFA